MYNNERDIRLSVWSSRIKQLCNKYGIPQKYLAIRLGVGEMAISYWIRGMKIPHPTHQKAIVDELLNGR